MPTVHKMNDTAIRPTIAFLCSLKKSISKPPQEYYSIKIFVEQFCKHKKDWIVLLPNQSFFILNTIIYMTTCYLIYFTKFNFFKLFSINSAVKRFLRLNAPLSLPALYLSHSFLVKLSVSQTLIIQVL